MLISILIYLWAPLVELIYKKTVCVCVEPLFDATVPKFCVFS